MKHSYNNYNYTMMLANSNKLPRIIATDYKEIFLIYEYLYHKMHWNNTIYNYLLIIITLLRAVKAEPVVQKNIT